MKIRIGSLRRRRRPRLRIAAEAIMISTSAVGGDLCRQQRAASHTRVARTKRRTPLVHRASRWGAATDTTPRPGAISPRRSARSVWHGSCNAAAVKPIELNQDRGNMNRYRPYDPTRPLLSRCSCGRHQSDAEHSADESTQGATSIESLSNDFVEAALVKALFPVDAVRRSLSRRGRCVDRARGDRQRPAHRLHAGAGAGQEAAREDRPEDRLHRDHLRHAADHGRSPRLL